jgi:adenylate cyclase
MSQQKRQIYEFDNFRLDVPNRELLRDGTPVALPAKAFDMLVVLIESGGRLVVKDDLFSRVWPDQIVEESNLTVQVSAIRKALGERKEKPHYITTVAGHGYRFTGNVKPSRSSPARIKSIAVLPFKPLVASERDESLELGMADTLITRLSLIGQLTVRPTSAVRQYIKLEDEAAKAGRELMVDAVLDGSIQKSGDRVRVGVRLVSVEQGQTLWTEQFDETFLNIFEVQDAISRKVAGALAVKLGGEEMARLGKHDTDSSEAYELYLKGRYFWNKFTPDDHQKATE